jgi:hypothetical protein
LACPRFAPTLSFRHIGLTGDLIYIKSRRLDFFLLFFPSRLPPCAAIVYLAARGLATAASSVRRTPTRAAASPPYRRTGLRRAPTRTAVPCLTAAAAASPSCHRAVLRRRHAVPPPLRHSHHHAASPLSTVAAVVQSRRHPKPPPLSRAVVRHHRGTLGLPSPRLLALPSRARSSQHHGSRQEKGEGTSG